MLRWTTLFAIIQHIQPGESWSDEQLRDMMMVADLITHRRQYPAVISQTFAIILRTAKSIQHYSLFTDGVFTGVER